MKNLFVLMISLLLIAGCATERSVLQLDLTPIENKAKDYFPNPKDGETPRYLYLGELLGENNLVSPSGKKENTVVAVLKWLAGLGRESHIDVLQRPMTGAIDDEGRILIVDVSRAAIYVFDEKEGKLDVWEFVYSKHFIAPTGIAIGPEGKIFVSDSELKIVYVLDRNGNAIGKIGEDILKRPHGIAWDANQKLLYVADTQDHNLKVFDIGGKLVKQIGQRGENPGEFNFPTHLSIGQNKLLVADTMNARVQILSLDDSVKPKILGRRGLKIGEFSRPKGVGMDSEGNIYVVESYFDHLLIFDKNGNFLLPIGGEGSGRGKFYLPGGLWVDKKNRVFVADTFNGRIEIFQFLGGEKNNDKN